MGTVTQRKKKNGSLSYRAQIVIQKDGRQPIRESRTFDRKKSAQIWIKKRETQIREMPDHCITGNSTKLLKDAIDFGVIMVLNLMIGLLSPPLGMVLYVLSAVSGVSMRETIRGALPFIIPLLVTLIIITFVPAVSLWLPELLGFK